MKIVITQDQIKLIKESTNRSAKLLGKFYDFEADGAYYLGDGMIQSRVRFTPKDFDNPMTPQYGESVCNWKIDKPFSSTPGENITFVAMNLPDSFNVPLMDHIGNTEELEEYLKGLHMEEVEEFIKRIIERRNNPLNESVDKNKKFLTNVMGQDFTGKIKEVKDLYDVPLEFGETIGPDYIRRVLNYFGPLHLVDIDGKKYLYQYRTDQEDGDYEWFHDEHGFNYVDGEIPEQLGLDELGLKFSDIIDIFYNQEGETLNEEENDKPDWLRENIKVKNLLKKLFENKEYDFSFKDKWEDLDGHIETYTFHYHIEILNAIGVGSDTIARVQVIIDDILLDSESVYDGWVEIGYSNNVWYINNLENHLDEEFFDVFPFSIYVNFYGHDEER